MTFLSSRHQSLTAVSDQRQARLVPQIAADRVACRFKNSAAPTSPAFFRFSPDRRSLLPEEHTVHRNRSYQSRLADRVTRLRLRCQPQILATRKSPSRLSKFPSAESHEMLPARLASVAMSHYGKTPREMRPFSSRLLWTFEIYFSGGFTIGTIPRAGFYCKRSKLRKKIFPGESAAELR